MWTLQSLDVCACRPSLAFIAFAGLTAQACSGCGLPYEGRGIIRIGVRCPYDKPQDRKHKTGAYPLDRTPRTIGAFGELQAGASVSVGKVGLIFPIRQGEEFIGVLQKTVDRHVCLSASFFPGCAGGRAGKHTSLGV